MSDNVDTEETSENTKYIFVLHSGYFFGVLLILFDTVLASYHIYVLSSPWESKIIIYEGKF